MLHSFSHIHTSDVERIKHLLPSKCCLCLVTITRIMNYQCDFASAPKNKFLLPLVAFTSEAKPYVQNIGSFSNTASCSSSFMTLGQSWQHDYVCPRLSTQPHLQIHSGAGKASAGLGWHRWPSDWCSVPLPNRTGCAALLLPGYGRSVCTPLLGPNTPAWLNNCGMNTCASEWMRKCVALHDICSVLVWFLQIIRTKLWLWKPTSLQQVVCDVIGVHTWIRASTSGQQFPQ